MNLDFDFHTWAFVFFEVELYWRKELKINPTFSASVFPTFSNQLYWGTEIKINQNGNSDFSDYLAMGQYCETELKIIFYLLGNPPKLENALSRKKEAWRWTMAAKRCHKIT